MLGYVGWLGGGRRLCCVMPCKQCITQHGTRVDFNGNVVLNVCLDVVHKFVLAIVSDVVHDSVFDHVIEVICDGLLYICP